MKPYFSIDKDHDIRLIPYSPAYERDELEVRVQVYNSGGDGSTDVVFMLDGEAFDKVNITVASGSYGLAKTFIALKDRAGEHTVSVKLTNYGDAVCISSSAEMPITVYKEPKPILDGGFIMLGPPNDRTVCDTYRDSVKSFTDDDWRRYVTEMKAIGQNCIMVMVAHQYLNIKTADVKAHYDSKLYPKSDIAADDPIAAILDEAGKNGQQVFIGVGNMYGYIGKPEDVEELFERYRGYKAFYGWYLALEFSMNFRSEKDEEKWNRYIPIVEKMRELSPVKPILTSPFAMPNEKFGEYLINEPYIDIMMPQDWVGQCAFTLEESVEMHRLLAPMCKAAKKHFWANCESFNWLYDENDKNKKYLVPRHLGGGISGPEGFDKQIDIAFPYVEKIMTFMLNGFFTPPGFEPLCGGQAAVEQYNDYIEYMNKFI